MGLHPRRHGLTTHQFTDTRTGAVSGGTTSSGNNHLHHSPGYIDYPTRAGPTNTPSPAARREKWTAKGGPTAGPCDGRACGHGSAATHGRLGENTEARKEQQERIQNVERYLAANPDWRNDAWIHRAQAYWEMGDKKPMAALVIYNKGVEVRAAGDYGEAMHLFGQAAHLDPGFPWSANNLAWTLSTCPDERLRDGKAAIAYSLCALGVFKTDIPDFLGTLAAAHAAAGDFETALAAVRQGRSAMADRGDGAHAAGLSTGERVCRPLGAVARRRIAFRAKVAAGPSGA